MDKKQLVQEAKDMLASVGQSTEGMSEIDILSIMSSTYDGGFSAFVAFVCEDGEDIDETYDILLENFGANAVDSLYKGVYDGKM